MTGEEFNKYLEERYEEQLNWYDKKSNSSKRWYYILKIISVFGAVTVLILINYNLSLYVMILAGLVALSESLISILSLYTNWIQYRTTHETLKKEQYLYKAQIGDYLEAENRERLFCERVESIVSRENTAWIIEVTQFEKKKK